MRQKIKAIVTLALAVILALPAAPAAATRTGFPDVPDDAWYGQELLILQSYLQGIINGIVDRDGVTRFHPDDTVKRGEFLKMAMTAAEGWTADTSRNDIHWAGKYYTIAMENDILLTDLASENSGKAQSLLLFPCTREALEKPITRYEMAVILTNTCDKMLYETTLITKTAYQHIPDYDSIGTEYVTAVEQAYGKGLLTGYSDGSFQGSSSLRRCEAAVVIYRLATGRRTMASWASEPNYDPLTDSNGRPEGFVSFAEWLQAGHLDAYDNPDREARLRLFGDVNKDYFTTVEEAAPYLEGVNVPVWYVDGKTGNKATKNILLVANKRVTDELLLIFQQIYNDPERFPIESAGVSRFNGETGRHAWGCAIDINPQYNCECYYNYGHVFVTCGSGWWPSDVTGLWDGRDSTLFHGSLSAPNEQSISPYGSVVKAFSDYGWGWGGNGWGRGENEKYDFMHFSVLANGG